MIAIRRDPTPHHLPRPEPTVRLTETYGEDSSSGPLGLYLNQIARTPLLTRPREIALAKAIDRGRWRFRRILLTSDKVLQRAVAVLRHVHEGRGTIQAKLQFFGKGEVDKEDVRRWLAQNLTTLRELLRRNEADRKTARNRSLSEPRRRAALGRLMRRRRRAGKLIT